MSVSVLHKEHRDNRCEDSETQSGVRQSLLQGVFNRPEILQTSGGSDFSECWCTSNLHTSLNVPCLVMK